MDKNTVYTIGHSTRSFEEFLALLNSFGIKVVADIRKMPGSRKLPHFDQEQLRKNLNENDVEYVYLEDLGGRRKQSKTSKNTAWRNKSFQAYADYMETETFETGAEKLKLLAREKPTAMMCSEAVWWRCHRSLVSDYLKAQGWKVLHIMSEGKATEHPHTSPAKVHDGKLTYGSDDISTN